MLKVTDKKNVTVPEGYQLTSIGLIPSDWDLKPLGIIANEITQTAGTEMYETVSISAGIGFVNQAKKFGKELSGNQYKKYIVLHKGDFSYNKGNSQKYPQGCIYRLTDRETAAVPNVFESFRIKDGVADYFEQLFISGFLNRQLFAKINHGVRDNGLLNLTGEDFYSCKVPFPPIKEQKKIAEILIQYDKIIELCKCKLEKVIKLKKACMDKMFPEQGKTIPEIRFQGFSGSWEQRKLSEFVGFFSGLTYTPDDVREAGTLVLRSSNVKNGEIVDADNVYVESEKATSENVKDGDIIIVVRNGSRALIGKHAEIKGNMPNTVIGAFMSGIRSKHASFVNALLDTSQFEKEIEKNMGATINQITGYMFSKMEFMIPSSSEQDKIGDYFKSVGHLITLYQCELDEMVKMKKALMQHLLTGKVRVKI